MAGEPHARRPRGGQMLGRMGPGAICMTSAIATGEPLFTPHIASLYHLDG